MAIGGAGQRGNASPSIRARRKRRLTSVGLSVKPMEKDFVRLFLDDKCTSASGLQEASERMPNQREMLTYSADSGSNVIGATAGLIFWSVVRAASNHRQVSRTSGVMIGCRFSIFVHTANHRFDCA